MISFQKHTSENGDIEFWLKTVKFGQLCATKCLEEFLGCLQLSISSKIVSLFIS